MKCPRPHLCSVPALIIYLHYNILPTYLWYFFIINSINWKGMKSEICLLHFFLIFFLFWNIFCAWQSIFVWRFACIFMLIRLICWDFLLHYRGFIQTCYSKPVHYYVYFMEILCVSLRTSHHIPIMHSFAVTLVIAEWRQIFPRCILKIYNKAL